MLREKLNVIYACLEIDAIKNKLGDECAQFLPIIHVVYGCDTISNSFEIGKDSCFPQYKCN